MKRYLVQSVLMGMLALALTLSMASGVRATELKEVFATGLTDHECHDMAWHFTITKIEGGVLPPESIHVVWANGAEADVTLHQLENKVAHYHTTANLDWQVTEASTFISEDWSGQFTLVHGPCDVIGPGKGTVVGTAHSDPAMHGEHHLGKGGHQAGDMTELPKTGDAEVQMAALLAALFGAALLLTGTAGRSVLRKA